MQAPDDEQSIRCNHVHEVGYIVSTTDVNTVQCQRYVVSECILYSPRWIRGKHTWKLDPIVNHIFKVMIAIGKGKSGDQEYPTS